MARRALRDLRGKTTDGKASGSALNAWILAGSLDSDDQRALGDAGMVRMLSLSYAGSGGPILNVLGELEDESGQRHKTVGQRVSGAAFALLTTHPPAAIAT